MLIARKWGVDVLKHLHIRRQVPWITRAAFAIAPMREGAPGVTPGG